MKKQFHMHCKSFFMELVSSLCFGGTTPPEPALIKSLLDIVFTERQGTKKFTFSSKTKGDAVPIIRSFLLQLLLEHKYVWVLHCFVHCVCFYSLLLVIFSRSFLCSVDQVKSHLQEYFDRSRQAMQESEHVQASEAIDQNLCLLCIQCFEVKLSCTFTAPVHLK